MRKSIQRIGLVLAAGFFLVNVVAFLHAYRFTHFSDSVKVRTADATELSFSQKLGTLFAGIDNPRPINNNEPSQSYSVAFVNSTERLECWTINAPNPKGTVIMFHGYTGKKSSLIERADVLYAMGFNTVLVDFSGSGGSGGSSTTIGFDEATQVLDCFNAFRESVKPTYLFGTSMGAAAILKSMDDYDLKPDGIILECPFGSLYKTVSARFRMMDVPAFPMAGLLTFWGGVQCGYWAFAHNPSEYAHSVACQTLLMFGEKDDRVSREEIDEIFLNLNGRKILKTYPKEGHNVFTKENKEQWSEDMRAFLNADNESLKSHAGF